MRKITSPTRPHKHGTAWLAAGLGLLLLAACGGQGGGNDQATPPARHVASGCALVIDDQALTDFFTLADRVAAGEPVPVADMGALTAQPVWDRWRRSFEPEQLSAARVGRALFIALRGRDALPERLRDKAAPSDLVGNYKVTLEQRARIEEYLQAFAADETGCEVFDILARWLDPAALPDTLRIDLLVGHPEIRLYEDHIMLDAGLAWAAGRGQLVSFLASTVYRDVATLDGQDPDRVQGPPAILETLRLVRNEGVPTLIDDFIKVTFDPRHRLLGGSSPAPDEICLSAQRTLISLDSSLDHVRSLPDAEDDDWYQLYRLFVGSRSLQPTGWYMAQVIENRFGHERLLAANATVADFVATYQEAALLSPREPEAVAGTLDWYLETAPAFSAATAAWFDAQLRSYFP